MVAEIKWPNEIALATARRVCLVAIGPPPTIGFWASCPDWPAAAIRQPLYGSHRPMADAVSERTLRARPARTASAGVALRGAPVRSAPSTHTCPLGPPSPCEHSCGRESGLAGRSDARRLHVRSRQAYSAASAR
jgi:hypothetical protein